MDSDELTCLRGRDLRYLLTVVLLENNRPMTVPELVQEVERSGATLGGRASKAVSDALRWEVRKGRVLRVGRSLYGPGSMPRSTRSWIRQMVSG